MNYNKYDTTPISSKMFITFVKKENLEQVVEIIKSNYTILFENIFVFSNSLEQDEYIISYSIDHYNVDKLLPNTCAVHRKKNDDFGNRCNTIYTLNGLNNLKNLNKSDEIEWDRYKNTIILESKCGELRLIETSLVKRLK